MFFEDEQENFKISKSASIFMNYEMPVYAQDFKKNSEDVVKGFLKIGFYIKSQKGIHIKICRMVNLNSQILIIPDHKEMKNGTLNSIYKKSKDYISEQELKDIFF